MWFLTLFLVISAGVVQYFYVTEKLQRLDLEILQFFIVFLGMFVGSAAMVEDFLYLWPYRLAISLLSGIAGVIGMRRAKRMTKQRK